MGYQIKEVSQLLGVSIYTLRYYEKIGMFDAVKRDAQGRRDFSEADILTINTIECLKQTGMPIKDIRHYVHLIPLGMDSVNERYEIFKNQQAKVEEQIKKLQESLNLINDKVRYYTEAKEHHTLNVCHDERSALVRKLLHKD